MPAVCRVLVSDPESGSIEPYLDVLRSVGLDFAVASASSECSPEIGRAHV